MAVTAQILGLERRWPLAIYCAALRRKRSKFARLVLASPFAPVGVKKGSSLLGLDRSTISRRCESKEIPATKVGNTWVIRGIDLERFRRVRLAELEDMAARRRPFALTRKGKKNIASLIAAGRGLEDFDPDAVDG